MSKKIKYKKTSPSVTNLYECILIITAIAVVTLVYLKQKTYAIYAGIAGCVLFFCSLCYNSIKKRSRRKKYLQSSLSVLDRLDGKDFEDYVKALFEDQGYYVEKTPASHDYGGDLLLIKNRIRTVVQVKRYRSKVGVSAVQQVTAAKAYYNATKAIVVTNNYYSGSAIKLAKINDVELWDRDRLIALKRV